MKQSDRQNAIISSFVLILLFCFIEIRWLFDNCETLGNDCQLLIFFGIMVVTMTIISVETYIKHQQIQGKWYQQKREVKTKKQKLVWTKAILRITLTSLLLSLPLFIQGGLGMLLSGVVIGLGLDVGIRGLTNNLPPLKRTDE